MKLLRRLITWLCFVGLLTAVWVPVFFWVRHTPRCTIDGRLRVHHLSTDGRWLLATDFDGKLAIEEEDVGEREPVERTRLKIFDTNTGRPVAAFDSNRDPPLSANGRHFVHRLGRDTFVIDLDTGEQWQLPVVHDEHFSRDGNALHVLDEDGWASVCLATRQVVRRFDTRVTAYPTENRSAVLKTGRHSFDIVDVDSGRTKQSLATGIDLEAGQYGSLWTPNERWFALCTNGNREDVAFDGRSIALRTMGQPMAQPNSWKRWLEKVLPGFHAASNSSVAVVDPVTGRERFRLQQFSYSCHLSRNGRALATVGAAPGEPESQRSRVQVWDVTPCRAYVWAIISSLGVGVILLLLRRWRQTRKAQGRLSQPVTS